MSLKNNLIQQWKRKAGKRGAVTQPRGPVSKLLTEPGLPSAYLPGASPIVCFSHSHPPTPPGGQDEQWLPLFQKRSLSKSVVQITDADMLGPYFPNCQSLAKIREVRTHCIEMFSVRQITQNRKFCFQCIQGYLRHCRSSSVRVMHPNYGFKNSLNSCHASAHLKSPHFPAA